VHVRTERAVVRRAVEDAATVIRVGGVFITLIMALGAIFGAMNTMFAAVISAGARSPCCSRSGSAAGDHVLVHDRVRAARAGGRSLGCLIALPINGITTSTTNWSSFSEIAFAFRVTPTGMASDWCSPRSWVSSADSCRRSGRPTPRWRTACARSKGLPDPRMGVPCA
jgi:putative ABC transport system permease protein